MVGLDAGLGKRIYVIIFPNYSTHDRRSYFSANKRTYNCLLPWSERKKETNVSIFYPYNASMGVRLNLTQKTPRAASVGLVTLWYEKIVLYFKSGTAVMCSFFVETIEKHDNNDRITERH